MSDHGKGNVWRQSFVLAGDATTPEGVRGILYVRPSATSRTGRYNERTLKAWLTAESGRSAGIAEMSGAGSIEVRGKDVTWRNVGKGKMTVGDEPGFPLAWDETFDGKRAPGAAAPVKKPVADPTETMKATWTGALKGWQEAGVVLWNKEATGRVLGFHPQTGDSYLAAGNLQQGIMTRRTTKGGEVFETQVAPDGKVTLLHDFAASEAQAQQHGVAPGTRLTEKTTDGTVIVMPGRPLAAQPPTIIVQ